MDDAARSPDAPDDNGTTDVGMTDEEKRRDQLLRLSGSTEADAAPRIAVSEHDGATRIDVADSAAVRPGGPGTDPDPKDSDES